jgi:hypothetical protein
MTPLYVVEDYGKWILEVYEDFVATVDFYEGVVEVSFDVEV